MQLDNDADKENVYVGDLITWTLEAKNKGPIPAKNVKVFDELPDGLKYVDSSATKGSFDLESGIWDIGDLDVGAREFLNIITKALTPGEKVNKANLTSDTNITDPDECYEEEEIDVLEHSKKVYSNKVSKTLLPTGNPIAILILSICVLLTANIRRRY